MKDRFDRTRAVDAVRVLKEIETRRELGSLNEAKATLAAISATLGIVVEPLDLLRFLIAEGAVARDEPYAVDHNGVHTALVVLEDDARSQASIH